MLPASVHAHRHTAAACVGTGTGWVAGPPCTAARCLPSRQVTRVRTIPKRRRRRRGLRQYDGFAGTQVWWVCLSVCPGTAHQECPAVSSTADPCVSRGWWGLCRAQRACAMDWGLQAGRGASLCRRCLWDQACSGRDLGVCGYIRPRRMAGQVTAVCARSLCVSHVHPDLHPKRGPWGACCPWAPHREGQPGWGLPGDPGAPAAWVGMLTEFY